MPIIADILNDSSYDNLIDYVTGNNDRIKEEAYFHKLLLTNKNGRSYPGTIGIDIAKSCSDRTEVTFIGEVQKFQQELEDRVRGTTRKYLRNADNGFQILKDMSLGGGFIKMSEPLLDELRRTISSAVVDIIPSPDISVDVKVDEHDDSKVNMSIKVDRPPNMSDSEFKEYISNIKLGPVFWA